MRVVLKTWPLLAALALLTVPMTAQAPTPAPTPTIEKKAAGLDALIATDAAFEKLGDGYAWTEGPVWNRKGGYLLFSDIPNNVIRQWKPGQAITDYLKPSGYNGTAPFTGPEPGSNGLTFDHQGRLVMCQHGNRRIARQEADGKIAAVVDKYQGKRLNSPNDLVYHSSGALYFTDPPYGLPKRWDDPEKELKFQGVYRLGTDGTLTLLTDELNAPNGLAFSPDEKTLYVAQSDPEKAIWMAYPVKADGTIGPGRVLLRPDGSREGEGAGASRRHEGGHRGQRLGDRARRRLRLHAVGADCSESSAPASPPRTSRGATTGARSTSRRTRRCSG